MSANIRLSFTPYPWDWFCVSVSLAGDYITSAKRRIWNATWTGDLMEADLNLELLYIYTGSKDNDEGKGIFSRLNRVAAKQGDWICSLFLTRIHFLTAFKVKEKKARRNSQGASNKREPNHCPDSGRNGNPVRSKDEILAGNCFSLPRPYMTYTIYDIYHIWFRFLISNHIRTKGVRKMLFCEPGKSPALHPVLKSHQTPHVLINCRR